MRSDILFENVLTIEQDFTLQARVAYRFVHTVQRAKKSGLSTAGWPDEGSDLVGGKAHADIKQALFAAVKEIDLGDGHAQGKRRWGIAGRGVGYGWRDFDRQSGPHRSLHIRSSKPTCHGKEYRGRQC